MSTFAKSVSIIVPTRNEAENVAMLVSHIVASDVPFHEILFVDDDSTDGTRDVIRSLTANHPIRFIEQDHAEPGLASAIMLGAEAAEGELLLIMDADLSHPPERINDLLAPLLAGTADMVIGSRYITGGSTPGWPFWRRMLSRAGAALAYPLTDVHDSMSGFFAIARSRLLEVAPPAIGFKIAFEAIVCASSTLRVCEIPVEFRDRARGQSKMSFGIALRFFSRWLIAVFRRILLPSSRKPSAAQSDFLTTNRHPSDETRRGSQHPFRVALDPGHTPKVPGAVGADGTVEYEFNKNIVGLIAADLRQRPGLSVMVINEQGEEIGLTERSAVANKARADLFLSVHHDSVNDKYLIPREVNGRTFYQTDKFHGYSVFFSQKNPQSSASFKFAEALGDAMRKQGFTPTRHHAEKIQGENRDLVIPKLGVYRFDDLVVLKEAEMPAALLECGVIVNPKEEADLKQDKRQAKIVAAVTDAIEAIVRSTENNTAGTTGSSR